MISIGDAVLKIGVDKGNFDRDMEGIGASIKKHQKAIGIGMTVVGTALVASLGLATKSAMEAVESENLFTVSLGENADAAREWSKDLSTALGLNSYELRRNVGVMYTMISSMGLGETAALDMSKGITELANDMASFYNLPTVEAFDKLRAGITGETEPLKRLGILVDEATIKTVALTHGIIQEGEELTQTQKVQARYLAIMEQTTAAQGDLARTMDSPLNKLRILGSTFDELKITIGEVLLPVLSSFLSQISDILKLVKEWVSEHPNLTKAIVLTTGAIGGLLLVFGPLLIMLPQITAAYSILRTFLLIHFIPVIWAHVTALWAQVTATLAALAATGALIPVAIAAVAAIALLATGVALLVDNQKKQYDSTNAVAGATGALAETTDEYGNVASAAYDKVGEAVDRVNKKLKEQIKRQKELMKHVGRQFSAGMTEAELQLYAPLIEGVEVPGQIPGTVGYYQALGVGGYAAGGIISKPTLAVLGEQAPRIKEYVFNENQLGMLRGGSVNIYVELDGRVIGRAVGQPLVDEIRLRTGVHI